jgi:hypothetical protein
MSLQTISVLRGAASLQFDGAVSCGVKTPLASAATDNFSLGIWAKLTTMTPGGVYALISNGIDDAVSNFNGFSIQVFQQQFRLSFNGIIGIDTHITPPPVNTWFHIAAVRISGTMRLYINGANTGFTTTQAPKPPTGFTSVGGTANATGTTFAKNFIGRLSGAFLYERALSGAEIAAIYAGQQISQTANVLWWQLNDGGGVLARDASGNQRNGAITTAQFVRDAPLIPHLSRGALVRTTTPSDTGRSLGLRGGTTFDNVTIPLLHPGLPCSFGVWFKMMVPVSAQRLLSYRSLTAGSLGGFEISENGTADKLTLAGYDSSGTLVINQAPTATFGFGEWHHVALTTAANNTTLYLDGMQVAADTTHTVAIPQGQLVTIGKASFTNGSAFVGLVDQFVCASGALWSASSVQALYNGTIPVGADCILGFDERSGAVAQDISGNGHNGTINASVINHFPDVPPHQPTAGRQPI